MKIVWFLIIGAIIIWLPLITHSLDLQKNHRRYIMLQPILKALESRTDKYGLIVQKDGDQGDSAYRTALLSSLLTIYDVDGYEDFYKNMLDQLTVRPGVFRRTAEPTHWGYNENNLSRDNAAKIILAAAINFDKQTIKTWFKQMLSRGLRHQNVHPGTDAPDEFRKQPDVISLRELANVIRGLDLWYFYPVLTILDFTFIGDLFFRTRQPWDYDSLMAIELIYANLAYPTIFSKIAAYFYKKTDYQYRIEMNYADINNGIAPLGAFYIKAGERYIE